MWCTATAGTCGQLPQGDDEEPEVLDFGGLAQEQGALSDHASLPPPSPYTSFIEDSDENDEDASNESVIVQDISPEGCSKRRKLF